MPVIVDALITKGTGLAKDGRLREGMALLEASLQLAREHQLLFAKRRVLNNIVYISAADSPRGHEEYHQEKLDDARRVGNRRAVVQLLMERAGDLTWELELDEARAILDDIDPSSLSEGDRETYERRLVSIATLTVDRSALLEFVGDRADERGDAQAAANRALDEASALLWAGRIEEAYEVGTRITGAAPIRLDILQMLIPALHLQDRERLVRVARLASESRFRGRGITLMRRAAEGAVAALDGRRDEAVEAFSEAVELAGQVWPRFHRALLRAEAASILGTEEEPGRSWGREAYATMRDAGCTPMLDLFADGLVPDGEVAAASDAAAG